MGYSTHYLGALQIYPSLNLAETAWLRSFRRSHRPLYADPYEVPMNPGVVPEDHPLVTKIAGGHTSYPGRAQDGGLSHCDWEPTVDGRWLRWVTTAKSNNALVTMRYLIDHFLRPGAHGEDDGREDFAAFTFDHVVSGTVAAERDDGRLFLLVAEENEVDEVVLVPGAGLW